MKRALIIAIILLCAAVGGALAEQPWFNLPEPPPPYQYGNMLIDRASSRSNIKSVTFSHWRHRLQYTCRVCHMELGFYMKLNATEITEEMNKAGEFCGACHNGKDAFGHTDENCSKCHNGDITYGKEKFQALERLPADRFGNRINWSKALKRGMIRPLRSVLEDSYSPIPFDKTLELESEYSMVPPAIFPHTSHVDWLDCANCHPDVFNIKKKTTKHFLMTYILEGKFCGVCHLNVAFPMDDCWRCHPNIKKDR